MQNSSFRARITSLYWSQSSPIIFWHSKQRLYHQDYKSLWVPTLICGFCNQNSDVWIRITSLYGSQTSPVVFACKTPTFGSELLVSMGPRLRLLICECKTACLDPEWHLSIGPSLQLGFCALKTATLASEWLVSMGPSTHLLLLHSKQRF